MSDTDKTAAKVIDEFCAHVMLVPEAERAAYIEITVCMEVAMMRGGAGDEYVRGFLKGALADLDKPADTFVKGTTLQ